MIMLVLHMQGAQEKELLNQTQQIEGSGNDQQHRWLVLVLLNQ